MESNTKAHIREEDYGLLIVPYEDAMSNLMTRLETLNKDYRRKYQSYPIHNMQKRIKSKKSIEEKLRKKGYEISAQEAKERLTDIAGVRIICYFTEDIYAVIELIKRQSDILVIREKDYIKKPKENGYRSYHVILGMPVYHTDGMEYYPVEIQVRTMTMDLWASMEHRICYKKKEKIEGRSERFKDFAGQLLDMEEVLYKMMEDKGTEERKSGNF